jgi:hypothetical protein
MLLRRKLMHEDSVVTQTHTLSPLFHSEDTTKPTGHSVKNSSVVFNELLLFCNEGNARRFTNVHPRVLCELKTSV